MDKMTPPAVGSTWRAPEGGHRMTVVGIEEDTGFVLVKRADSPKKALAHTGGAYIAAPSDFAEWKPA